MRNRIALAALALFLLSAPAHADTFVLDASFNEAHGTFPTHRETFVIPTGHRIVSASISGFVSASPDSGAVGGFTLGYNVDGFFVPTITIPRPAPLFPSGSFSFTFPESELFRFADGEVIVGNCSLTSQFCLPGMWIERISGTLTITTAPIENNPAPVPEPATLLLLSTGLAGAAAIRKRRRRDG